MEKTILGREQNAPLRILHVASGDLWAGAEVQIFNLALAQSRMPDQQVAVALLNPGQLETRLRAKNIQVHVFPEESLSSLQILIGLRSLLRRWRPKVIHTHRQKENVLASLAQLFLRGCLSVRTVHGASEFKPQDLPWSRRMFAAADDFVGRFIQSAVIAVSEYLAAQLIPVFGAGRVHCVANGLDPEALRASARRPLPVELNEPKRIRIGCFARLVPVKRLDIFIDVARLANALPESRVDFFLAGDGPMREEVCSRINALPDPASVNYLGYQPETPPLIAAMDAIMLTSDHEGMPMLVLEAMLLGVPVIARRVGGIPQMLGDGEFGTLIDSSDPSEFASMVTALDRDPRPFLDKAARARAHAETNFTAAAAAERYGAIYRSLL